MPTPEKRADEGAMKEGRGKIPLSAPSITLGDKRAVVQSLDSRWLTGGPKAILFEKAFANYVGTASAVSVNSCTAALHLSMRALGVGPGDEVIVPVLTFAATANAALFCGAKPVFADINPDTLNVSPEDIIRRISPATKAIVPVHYGGQPCDMREIMEIASDYRVQVVEDCAHSLGAEYDDKQCGNLGTTGCFSFYPTKNITTLEGGMLTTNDEKLALAARRLREHGMDRTARDRESVASWKYDVTDLGYNYRLTEPQAALGISQLRRLPQMTKRRIAKARYLTEKLSRIRGLLTPTESTGRTHVYHLYVIRVLEQELGITRDELFDKMTRRGVGLSVHYTPLHLFSYYRTTLGYHQGDFPVAEQLYRQILTLPMFSNITEAQVDTVVSVIRNIVK